MAHDEIVATGTMKRLNGPTGTDLKGARKTRLRICKVSPKGY
jgi:hypothetical protein